MYNHAPPGYECFVCDIVAGELGDNVVVAENERALAERLHFASALQSVL